MTSESLWYFAIGSMTHPMSCKGRNIVPQESKPALLLEYRLHFFGPTGIAEALPAPGHSFHGVAHLVDKETMDRLDTFEIGYTRVTGTAKAYDGTEISVQCYSRPLEEKRGPEIDKNPTERYIDIIASGCEHFGVEQEHIKFLKSMERQARPKPHRFQKLGEISDDLPSMTRADIEAATKNGDRIMVTVNGKVFEVICDKDTKMWNVYAAGPFRSLGTFEAEVALSQALFDPLYGICLSLEDVSREHSAYIEDMQARWPLPNNERPWKLLAKYADQKYKD